MFLYKGKEYYPLEIEQILAKDGGAVYDRGAREKAYVYIDINTQMTE